MNRPVVSRRGAGRELAVSLGARERWESIASRHHGIGFRANGSLTVAGTPEEEAVLATLNSPRFVDTSPVQAYYMLLEEGTYIASVSTFYGVPRAKGQVRERRHQAAPCYRWVGTACGQGSPALVAPLVTDGMKGHLILLNPHPVEE